MGGKGSGRKKTVLVAPKIAKSRALTMRGDWLAHMKLLDAQMRAAGWPAVRWQKDPVGFVREVLHGTPLPHQCEILRAAAGITARVAVRSGQKTGKTRLVIWLALWMYCCFPEANVFMTANSKEQVGRVLWRELKSVIRSARARGFEIEEPAENPATGVQSADGRSIRGFTVREKEAMAGISGGNLMAIVDEASALEIDIAHAIEGNFAAGGRMIWISNPTRSEGPFFDAFHVNAPYWTTFHLSSADVAAHIDAEGIEMPGVANKAVIEGWREKYGEDSPFYTVRVKGEFLKNETGKIIDLDMIAQSQARWADTSNDDGVLAVGIDPAGPGDAGDEFAFAIVRGKKLLLLHAVRGLAEDAAIEQLRGFLAQYRNSEEIPRVCVDAEGPIGSALYGRLKAISENLKRHAPAKSFDVFGVKSSHYAKREPQLYDRVREELWANLASWLKNGGAIMQDWKLETELNAPDWEGHVSGKLKVTPKPELKAKLDRSPDRADALCLAVWEPMAWLDEHKGEEDKPSEDESWGMSQSKEKTGGGGIDPYATPDPYGGRIDPYTS